MILLLVKKFMPALSGLRFALKDKSIVTQVFIGFFTIILTILLDFTTIETVIVLFLIAFIISLEIINTVIEEICNLYSQDFDLKIKKIKDLMSFSILFSGIISAIIFIIFIIN